MRMLCYTRQPKEDILYANRLAYSMHLAWESETGAYIPFHHNEGILYAKATQDMQTGVLCAKSLKNPWIFHTEGGSYGSRSRGYLCGGRNCFYKKKKIRDLDYKTEYR